MKLKEFIFQKNIDMTTGSTKELIGKIFSFAIPVVLLGFLEIFFQSFDLIAVQSKEGELAASAIGATSALVTLLTDLFIGLSTGINIVMSRYYGEKDKESAERIAYSGIVLGILFPLVSVLIGEAFLPNFLHLLNVKESYFNLAKTYLRYYFICLPFLSLYNFGAAIFRGIGDSKTPLIFLIVSGIVHIGLNYLFVYAFSLSVKGTALSNVISYALGTILVFAFLKKKSEFFVFHFRKIRLYKKEALEILHIGIPNCVQNMVFSFTNLILATIINDWGETVVTVIADCSIIESYVTTILFSFSSSGATFISANFGKGDKANIKKIFYITLLLELALGLGIGSILLACYKPLLMIFTNGKSSDTFYSLAFTRLSIILLTLFLYGMMNAIGDSIRSLNRPMVPMIISLVFVALFRIFWNYVVYSPDLSSSRHVLWLLYLCYPVSYTISILCQTFYFSLIKKKVFKDIDKNKALYLARLEEQSKKN